MSVSIHLHKASLEYVLKGSLVRQEHTMQSEHNNIGWRF